MQGFNPALISQQLSVFAIMAMGYDPTLGMEAHYSARIEPENLFELESVDAQLPTVAGTTAERTTRDVARRFSAV